MNESLEELAKELKAMEKIGQLRTLAQMAVEGLDAILLSLMDILPASTIKKTRSCLRI